ncbi:hypothetical protein PGTUg99_023417 [Puccinia graminis f. sp. tritici]|uniref:Uncharacterized protein n=1 Tax=Puccinia graminis f. sp. tritici TaxID=56615 RepID=A0A5B0NWN3_PUCGR|nr:hypothetical protein PGTUg99_023417 [Puccinia graminis f. sp. tritici]
MSILRAWFAFTLLMCFMVTTMSASYTAVCAACGTPATIECREATLESTSPTTTSERVCRPAANANKEYISIL